MLVAALLLFISPVRGEELLRVEISAARTDQGKVLCALFGSYDGFPGDVSKAITGASGSLSSGRTVCEFRDLKPGEYAVSVVHDEDSDGKLKTGWFGIPKEGVGASNDAKGSFGPPKFNAARFEYKGGALTLQIHLVYL